MKKRLLACLLTAAMLTSLLPLPALAVEAEPYIGGLCPHHQEHSFEDCGFIEAVEGRPCGHVCPICTVQTMIDALPAPEGITADNRAEVGAQLEAIDEARVELTDKDSGQLDTTRYQTAVSALSELDGQAENASPLTAAEIASGDFGTGNSLHWSLDGNGALTITGTGDMPDFNLPFDESGSHVPEIKVPWAGVKDQITSALIHEGVTSIGTSAFEACTNMVQINLPNSLISIRSAAFCNCAKLTLAELPSGLQSIGSNAFDSCTSLTLSDLPDSLTTIANAAFKSCTSLALKDLPSNLRSIGENSFNNCTGLTEITLPASLTTIDGGAFWNCTGLTSVTFTGAIPPALATTAFTFCANLQTINVPAGAENAYRSALGANSDKIPSTEPITGTYLTWDDTRKQLVPKDIPNPITEVTDSTTELNGSTTGGWYIVRNSVEISSRVTVSGNVHLILKDGCDLAVTGGINVSAGNSLTIYAQTTNEAVMGILNAEGDRTSAGIGSTVSGSSGNSDCGTIIINGGKVIATSTRDGAGIGGAGGTIIINGGVVEASSYFGAGIGGDYMGDGGEITITGGTVTATGGVGAGIGGGAGGAGGMIIINGGSVEASSDLGAGIGGGSGGAGGTITINDGTVTASSSSGAGIGGGERGSGGEIIINGGKVEATGEGGAGIGGGSGDGGEGRAGGTITINGGTVTASGSGGAGIGGGSGDYAGGSGGKITINGNAKVEATSYNGAGIGGGRGSEMVGGAGGEITISGGTVTATSDHWGAGIGGGGSSTEGGSGGTITISGGTVTATGQLSVGTGGAGIGGGGSNNGLKSESGTFITGPNGSAFIVASSISDQSGKGGDSWRGVIFEENDGKVYGDKITLTTDVEIPTGKTLEIEVGRILTIGVGVTLTNYGTITGSGTIQGTVVNNGTIANEITIQRHSHQWDTAQWSSDATHHWHRCTVTGCGERNDTAAHTFGEWTTATTAGSRSRTCSECGYKETETIPPAHSHSYGQAWKSDAAGHWHECSCGDKSGYAAHTPGEWIIDREATSSTPGQRHKECTVCGYTMETETIPATGGSAGGGGGGGTYTPPTYKPDVSKPSAGGGTPAVTPSNPKQGDTVTVTPKPDSGYEVDKIAVTDRNGKPVEVTKKPDGTYTFQQPSGKVTIEVAYRPIDRPWNNPFTDVSEGDWYYEAVQFVQERGLMNGYSDDRFGPNDTLSRAQLAQILFNKEGRPAVNGGGFNDVDSSAWYADAVTWAAENGIVGGYGNGIFGPNDPITREQLAVMLWRYSGSPAATNKELRFDDADEISPFALEALRWAVENGVLNGYGDGRLGPQGQATRAQVAQMLKNFIENQEENT